jgi:drug/metabolite transporter (DMT)-like permease
MTINPVLVVVMSAFFLKEIITGRRIIGILLGAAGALFLMLNKADTTDYGTNPSLGNLFVFINAVSYAVYLVIVKPLMLKYNPLQIALWVFFVGWIMVLPLGIGQFAEIQWHTWTPAIYAAAAFVVIGTTFIAYLFNIYSLKTLSSTTVSIYIYLQPLLATAVSLGMGKEHLNWQMVLAAIMIFGGVYLVSVRK